MLFFKFDDSRSDVILFTRTFQGGEPLDTGGCRANPTLSVVRVKSVGLTLYIYIYVYISIYIYVYIYRYIFIDIYLYI